MCEMQNDGRPSDSMKELLEYAPLGIFVTSESDHILLYANAQAKSLFSAYGGAEKKTCYEAVGFDQPCIFCRRAEMGEGFFEREFQHPMNGFVFSLKGRKINWEGQPAIIEYVTDVTEWFMENQRRDMMQEELTTSYEKMQSIINAIPGGVAIYRLGDILETTYFSEGVPMLSGYTMEEYQEMTKKDALEMAYPADVPIILEQMEKLIVSGEVTTFSFRKRHRDGHIVWVRVQASLLGEEDGCPLLHCVFHNITEQKNAEEEMDHLINSLPGGIISYRLEEEGFIPTYFSDGVAELSGYSREEFEKIMKEDAISLVYEGDRRRLWAVTQHSLESGEVLDASYRIYHKSGDLIWVHLNGRRMEPFDEGSRFYAVFTGISAETRMFQCIAGETADGIYVIEKESYELLYINETRQEFQDKKQWMGQKCYEVLYGRALPVGDAP